jgi:hypothetical protein
MLSPAMRRLGLAAGLLVGLIVAPGAAPSRTGRELSHIQSRSPSAQATAGWPTVILWAWQRPNDLSFINPRRVGVSYLVETVRLKGDAVIVEHNPNGLRVPSGTWLMACARIETDPGFPPTLSHRQVRESASQLNSLAKIPGVKALQIDFDATVGQRNFYRNLLATLRHRLPPSLPISITALASWCEGDDWISQLPVNEAVPMLFRMGPDRAAILLRLQAGDDFEEPLCRSSAGISTDESVPRLAAGRRLYIFNPSRWTAVSFEGILSEQGRSPSSLNAFGR